jgi:uncharacterized protein HemY
VDARSTGLWIAAVGAIAVVIGLLVASGVLGWFGRLPGDIRIETETTRVYVPLTSMIIVSVIVSVVVAVIRRFL